MCTETATCGLRQSAGIEAERAPGTGWPRPSGGTAVRDHRCDLPHHVLEPLEDSVVERVVQPHDRLVNARGGELAEPLDDLVDRLATRSLLRGQQQFAIG